MDRNMKSLKNKIVVVTGSTRGYGYAIAESLLEAGATVAITGRSQEAIQHTLDSLQPKGSVSGFMLDVRQEEQVYSVVEQVIQKFGRIDIWINNAGYSNAAGMMLDMDPEDTLELYRTNNLGVLYCTQAILHRMLPNGQGLLVNIYGAGSFLRPASPTGLYGATKAWITSFTRSLAKEIKGSGVQLLGFSPGMLITDMLTSPTVVGERGREMMNNYGFVLRFIGRPAKPAADDLVKVIIRNRREFKEVKMFKPWTPFLGLLRVAWENLTKTGKTPEFELHYQNAYRSKFLKQEKNHEQ
jgi:NAD(P)-dependent dehydrogenase (short-subunit alcohol dehydrogenase family)